MNEQEQFLKELEQNGTEDPFAFAGETPEEVKEESEPEEDPEAVAEDIKNRRHKRLEAKLQAEREANIALNARLAAIAEAKSSTAEGADYLKTVERIYGTDSPEALAATELLKTALLSVKEEAKREAIETLQEQRRKEQEEVAKAESELDSMLEEIEDTYSVDLTSTGKESTRKAYFALLEKMSPKDSNGDVIAYADHHAVWEAFQSKLKKPETRAKDLASRTMTQSGAQANAQTEDDATLRFLKENGLI